MTTVHESSDADASINATHNDPSIPAGVAAGSTDGTGR